MRSYLFVPGDDEDKIVKAFDTDADAVILDLEDSVAPSERARARSVVCDALEALTPDMRKACPRPFVRVNPLGDGEAFRDLDAIMPGKPAGIVLPKSRSGEDAKKISEMLVSKESEMAMTTGTVKLIVVATETARSMFGLSTYGGATPRLIGMGWGAEDLSADMGATANRGDDGRFLDPYILARSLCLYAAHAARIDAIDTVYVNYKDHDGFRQDCREALRDGFTSKMAIHPAQVPIINDAFTPSKSQVDKAKAIIDAFGKAGNVGVVGLDGEMFDRPHLIRSKKLVARADEYGVKDDEPEKPATKKKKAGKKG
ncbi:MAG: CoA ester lyase [Pseudomonadota bacterium]